MIKIRYDHGTVEAGGSVFHLHNNIRDRVTYESAKDESGTAVEIKIKGYDKDHEFNVALQATLILECVVIKLDEKGEVSIEKMSEQSFMSRKHLQ